MTSKNKTSLFAWLIPFLLGFGLSSAIGQDLPVPAACFERTLRVPSLLNSIEDEGWTRLYDQAAIMQAAISVHQPLSATIYLPGAFETVANAETFVGNAAERAIYFANQGQYFARDGLSLHFDYGLNGDDRASISCTIAGQHISDIDPLMTGPGDGPENMAFTYVAHERGNSEVERLTVDLIRFDVPPQAVLLFTGRDGIIMQREFTREASQ